MTRRDINLLLPLLAGAAAIAQDKKNLPSGTFRFEELPVKVGGENRTRAVLNGATHKGSAVEMHLTELGPGMAPHAPHKHPHEEMVLVQYGELDVTISGNTTRLTPGSVAFVASNEEHGWKNPTAGRTQYFVVALPVGFLTAGAVGMALERGVIRFLYGRPLETLLATWGISLVLQQAVRSIFGAPNKEVINPGWMTGGFAVTGGFIVTWNRLAIIAFCLVVLGALALILRRSQFGLEMRAVAQNRPMASAMGIATARIDMLTFGLGSGIAGMAGVALSQIGNVSPNLGTFYIVDSFLVVVFGGVGTLAGTVIGAFSLGIVNKLLEPYAGAVLGKVLVLVAIILFIQRRPRGLFALKGRAAEL